LSTKAQRKRRLARRRAANEGRPGSDRARRSIEVEFERSWQTAIDLAQSEAPPVRHHRVPVFLLRNWSDADGRIRCFDLDGRKTFVTKPERVMCERNYYRMEDVLWDKTRPVPSLLYELALGQIETKGAAALRRWLDDPDDLTTSDFAAIASLLAVQSLRGEHHRNAYREAVASAFRDTMDPNDDDPDRAWFARELKAGRWSIAPDDSELVARTFDLFQPTLEAMVSRMASRWVV